MWQASYTKKLKVQVKNKTKQVDNFQNFETNHRNLYYTNESLRIIERNFLPTDVSETDLRDTKKDQLFVSDPRGMFENLKEIELLNCHIKKNSESNDSSTPMNGNERQIFLKSTKRSAITRRKSRRSTLCR